MSDNDWLSRYRSKTVSVSQALSHIRRGSRIFVGAACGEPQALVKRLIQIGRRLEDSEVYLLTLGTRPPDAPRLGSVFRHNSFFIGPEARGEVEEGRADYTPVFLSEVPGLFRSGRIPIDVALIQVSPPDAHGNCSLGIAVDITKPAAEAANLRIAQLNRFMPRTLGDSFIHVDKLDFIVEHDEPLLTARLPEPDATCLEVGRHVAKLVEDGSCLQVGVGAAPSAVLAFLSERRNLGLHTELLTDAMLPLLADGVITNARKNYLPGLSVVSFCIGGPDLYRFVDDNPAFHFAPSDCVNDPFLIAKNDGMVAVNGALEIDLTGQVCSDSLGYKLYSGIGGQVDFIRGAARSRGGKPVICLPSTTRDGQSRIVPRLSEGAGVVTTRGDVHYVVTEYGVAYLYGKSVRERTVALIEIAHPEFRRELLNAAKERRYVFLDQEVPRSSTYPDELERYVSVKDEGRILLRPLRPTDDSLLKDFFYDADEHSIYQRFLSPKMSFPRRERDAVANIDYHKSMSIAATAESPEAEQIVALAEWRLDESTRTAEIGLLVRAGWHRRGVGTKLLAYLTELAIRQGIIAFTAQVLGTNRAMIHLFQQCGYPVRTTYEDGVYSVRVELAEEGRPPATGGGES